MLGKDLHDLAEKVNHLGSGAMCLIGHDEEKSVYYRSHKGPLEVQAGKRIRNRLSSTAGGGKPEMAQGGGTNVAAIPKLLTEFMRLISAS